MAIIAVLAYILWDCCQYVPHPAYGEEPCIRATTDYQRIYPPQGTILNRRPANWQICTPWGP